MPNQNYINGRAGEYYVRNTLEDLGYTVTRAAASQGVFDIIGLGARGLHEHNVAVQVKTGKTKPSPAQYASAVETDLLESTHRIVLFIPTGRQNKPRVIYSSIRPLPAWCTYVGWRDGDPPRQLTLRLPREKR